MSWVQEKYTNAFLGSGDERSNFALELTYEPAMPTFPCVHIVLTTCTRAYHARVFTKYSGTGTTMARIHMT